MSAIQSTDPEADLLLSTQPRHYRRAHKRPFTGNDAAHLNGIHERKATGLLAVRPGRYWTDKSPMGPGNLPLVSPEPFGRFHLLEVAWWVRLVVDVVSPVPDRADTLGWVNVRIR